MCTDQKKDGTSSNIVESDLFRPCEKNLYRRTVNPVSDAPLCTIDQNWQIIRLFIAETIGTALLAFSVVRMQENRKVHLGGYIVPLTLALGIWLSGPVSGGHLNPAVTLTLCLTRVVSFAYLPIYLLAQFAGAFCGAAMADAFNTASNVIGISVAVGYNSSLSGRILAELFASSVFLLVVVASADSQRPGVWSSSGFSTSLAVGLIAHVMTINFGGDLPCGLNPAATLGPSVILNNYANFWINFLVPFLGSILAAALFQFAFCPDSGCRRTKAFLCSRNFSPITDHREGS